MALLKVLPVTEAAGLCLDGLDLGVEPFGESSLVIGPLRESRSCDYQSDKRAPTNASDSPRIARSTIRTARATRWRCKSRPGPIPIATRCACSPPSASYRRACSSGVEWAKITHRNATVAMSNTMNVSRTRITDSSAGPTFITRRPRSGPPRHRAGDPFSTRGTPDAPDVAAPSVAVVPHGLPSRYLPASHCHQERTHG